MFAILTSKPGQYHAEAGDGAQGVESYDYLFYGKLKAVFQIIELEHETRVCITEDTPPYIRNSVPTKFLEKFSTLEEARSSLQALVSFGKLDARLRPSGPSQAADRPSW